MSSVTKCVFKISLSAKKPDTVSLRMLRLFASQMLIIDINVRKMCPN